MIALGVKVTKRNRIPEVRANLRPRVEAMVNAAATQIAVIARQLCPVDTGALRDSIAIETYAGHRAGFGMAKAVVVFEHYAPFVEFGTSKSAAQPFLMPAFEAVRPSLEQELKKIAKL